MRRAEDRLVYALVGPTVTVSNRFGSTTRTFSFKLLKPKRKRG